jgi:hypothetical protein
LPITARNPTAVLARIAQVGTPLARTRPHDFGASPRRDSENAIREAVYSAEFRHDATAVSTTRSSSQARLPSPIASSAAWKDPTSTSEGLVQETRDTTTKIEPR